MVLLRASWETVSDFKSISEQPVKLLSVLLLKDFLIFQGGPCIVASGNGICSKIVHSIMIKATELDMLIAVDVGVWSPSFLILIQKVTGIKE